MGFGAYDEEEHERREGRSEIDINSEPIDGVHDGEMTTEGGEDTTALLDQLDEIKADNDE